MKSFLRRLCSNGPILVVLNQGIVSLAGVLSSLLIGRAAGKEELGLYVLASTVMLFVSDIQLSIVSTPYMIISPRVQGTALSSYNGSTLAQNVLLSVLAASCIALLGLFLDIPERDAAFQSTMITLAAALVFIQAREFVRRFCFANLRSQSVLLFDAGVTVLQLSLLVAGAYIGSLSAVAGIGALGVASAVAAVAWLRTNRGEFHLQSSALGAHTRGNWELGRWVLASAVLWALGMNMYPWLISYYHGPAATGAWGACITMIGLANVPLVGAQNLMGPRIARAFAHSDRREARAFVLRLSALLAMVVSAPCFLLFFFGSELLVMLYGPEYAGNGHALGLLAISLLAGAAAFPASRGLFALERADVDFYLNFVPLFVLGTIGVWCVRTHGLFGASLGLLVAQVGACVVRLASFVLLSRPSAR